MKDRLSVSYIALFWGIRESEFVGAPDVSTSQPNHDSEVAKLGMLNAWSGLVCHGFETRCVP